MVISAKLENDTSIKNVELIGIKEAIKYAIRNNYHYTTIYTDSLNACMALEKVKYENKLDTHAVNIYKKIKDYPNYNFVIQYIPSHIGL